jgi:branched-subunit amino acid aminotransferase/4-amino-4-deoxychorismate lyase
MAGQQSDGIPVLETAEGAITETAIGHVVAVFGTPNHPVLIVPPENLVLPGITLEVVRELAAELGYTWDRRAINWNELSTAHEILLVGSGFGVTGVSSLEGTRLDWPGPITRAIETAFAKRVAMPTQ